MIQGLVIFGIGFRVLWCCMGDVDDNEDMIGDRESRGRMMWNFMKFIKE